MVFIAESDAISISGEVPLEIPTSPESELVGLSFVDVDGLLEATVPPPPPSEPPPEPPPPFSVFLDDATGPWSLQLPQGAIVDPTRVQDLWVLVRYHVTPPPSDS